MSPRERYTMPPNRRSKIHCLIFPFIGVVIALSLFRIRHHISQPLPPPDYRALPTRFDAPVTPPIVADVALLADVYPSRQSAIRALAQRLPDAINQINDKPAVFHFSADESSPDAAAIYDALQSHFPTARFIPATDSAPPAVNDVTLKLVIDEQSPKSPRAAAKGTVRMTLSSSNRATSLSTKFSQCDWADDLTNYTTEHPGHTWIVARSPKPCASSTEARHSAEEAAVEMLMALMKPTAPSATLPPGEGRSNIHRGDIRNQLPISDRFVQQFRRPYGNVWEEAILLDVSPQWTKTIRSRQAEVISMRETRVHTTVASMAIVILAILVAYALANMMTKRYFMFRLRAIAIVSILTAIALAAGLLVVA
jgi:hypothetical protein